MSNRITQDMAHKQSLMKYAEKYGVTMPAGSTTGAVRASTSGGPVGMKVWSPWLASLGGLTATQTSIQQQSLS